MAKVLADGEVVSVVGAGTFNASSPLDRSVNTITSSDDFPSKRADVGSRLSKNTRALAKVQVLVSLDRGIPRLVKVVERDIGVLDDKVVLTWSFRFWPTGRLIQSDSPIIVEPSRALFFTTFN